MKFLPHTVRDQIAYFNDASALRRPAFAVINGLQQTEAKPGDQVLGTAVALIAMCESIGVSFDEVVRKAVRVMNDVEGPFTSHLQAVRDYATGELLHGGF